MSRHSPRRSAAAEARAGDLREMAKGRSTSSVGRFAESARRDKWRALAVGFRTICYFFDMILS
jgi:hypothetical protein